jgi:hypothetical protein
VYEEGLQPQQSHDLLGSSRLATQRESERLKIYPLGSDSSPVKFAKIDNPEDDLPFFC